MSQRRRFYAALSLLLDIEDWAGLEYIEQVFDRKRGEILARCICELRERERCDGLCGTCSRSCRSRLFDVAFTDSDYHLIE